MLLNALAWLALGASIVLNYFLYKKVKQYYFELNQTRLDPLGLEIYPVNSEKVMASQQVTDKQQIQVVFLGDSRAASWTAPQIEGYGFENRGIPGQTTAQTIARFTPHVRPLKPDVVVIQVGINDLKTIALFPDRQQSIIAHCQTNIKRLVAASKSLGAVVIVTTIFPVGKVPWERKLFWSEAIAPAVQETNAYIATLADENVLVLDTVPILADHQGMVLPQYQSDELHLNEQAYTTLNEALVRLLSGIKPNRIKSN